MEKQSYSNTLSTQKVLLALLVPALMTNSALAEENNQNNVVLDKMVVTLDKKTKEKVGEKIVTRQELNEQMIQNSHDLVRYNTEVDVAEFGRYGGKGFAVRGVDGNRVALAIDGVSLPEIEVNELYSPYGYTYEGRFSPDLELMDSVRIQAGADSLSTGSGAVGGSVNYSTKTPNSVLKAGDNLGGYVKVGYSSKNDEKMVAAGLAGRNDKAEILVNYAYRTGHELKNHDNRKHNKERLNDPAYDFGGKGEFGNRFDRTSALYPDSANYDRHSALIKGYYHLNDEHRLGVHALYQQTKTKTNAISKSTAAGKRIANDEDEMKAYGLNYRYQPNESKWLDEVKAEYVNQNVYGLANTSLYESFAHRLSLGEYRPTETTTNQFKLEGSSAYFDWGKFGNHQFKLTGAYGKQDYKSTKVTLDYDRTGKLTNAFQQNIIPFPDAKKDSFSLTLSDDIQFGERFKTRLGVRYDHYKYAPYFQDDIYFDDPDTSEVNEINKALKFSQINFYKDYRNGVYEQKPKFSKLTYSGLFEYQVIPDKLTARYKVGTGFLAPTVTQMYSSFQGLGAQQLINTKLKAETSLNNELELEFNLDPVNLTLAAYQSDYKNFIHTKYWDRWEGKRSDCTESTCLQSFNLDNAKVYGYKAGLRADLSRWLNGNRLYLTADYHTAKDSAKIEADQAQDGILEVNTLASVPTSTILGLDYHTPDDKATLHIKARHLKAKKADDTKMVVVVRDRERTLGYREEVKSYKHIDKASNAFVLDVYGSYKFNKNRERIALLLSEAGSSI